MRRMESTLRFCKRILLLCLVLFFVSIDSQDPCYAANHQTFPQDSLGSRNEVCDPKVSPICDYYLKDDWYVLENATLMNHCPIKGNCGVAYPTWMNGGFPRVQDGEVNQTACIKMDGDCCKMNVTMTIKNCTSFFVFYLPSLPACPMAYCFKSTMPCDPPTTVGTTPKGSASTGIFHTTSEVQDSRGDEAISNGNSNTLLIALCSGILALLLGAAAVVFVWILATGRCKKQHVPTAKNATVSPENFDVSYNNTPPPLYSEK
ncbi:oncoprotein-induced transcript 3 protein-like [Mercenaria mercenaria]|uniref:oncoprotein-induced transcript 3 protein-like n=1 Tax=Mercenaria mercenaria TaxID=6596 RepID=UPI00234E7671|nr:oncoprotein-induced transcript 3 protein-like [Mercenaria mercenaria]